jgi:bacterioferritin-associated ferredoxin
MIVCHCMHISDSDIRSAVNWMRASDPMTVVTPGKIYRALGKTADCGGCMPLFLDTMRQTDGFKVPFIAPNVKQSAISKPSAINGGSRHEGRQESHRVSERSSAL